MSEEAVSQVLPDYAFLLIGMVFVVASWLTVRFYHRGHPRKEGRQGFKWSYLLVGPFLIDLLRTEVSGRESLLTKRETLGWAVVAAILVALVAFEL